MTRRGGRTFARALDLDRALARARDLAPDLAVALDLVRDRDLDLDRDPVFTLARDLDCDPVLTLARDLVRDRALDRALDRDRDLARDLARALALTRDRARDLALALAHAHARDRDLRLALAVARDLALALEDARCFATLKANAGAASGARSTPGRATQRLVALAVRLLPVAQRPRYREEFSDELAELPRKQRCGYALRVLARAWQLRRALVEAVRTADGEPVRRAER